MMDLFFKRQTDKIGGVLSCWDRGVITGTVPGICYAMDVAVDGKQIVRTLLSFQLMRDSAPVD